MSMPASRADSLALNLQQQRSTSPATSNPSPIDGVSGPASVRPFGLPPPGLGGPSKMSSSRTGSVSPSHELGSSSGRLFPKRAREIQAQEAMNGMPVNLWAGPPTSGNSTPLRENIPESPTDGFPDFTQLPSVAEVLPLPTTGRRARAGTVPSRFSPGGVGNSLVNIPALVGAVPKTSRPTPSQTPFKSPSPGLDGPEASANASASASASSSTLLSRLRAGSMPQRSPFGQMPATVSPFGPSIFTNWNPTTRDRASTLASIASLGSNGPSSPAQSAFSREGQGDSDVHMRTLDYLGLAETPQPPRATLATPYMPNMADFSRSASRFRSYSVNNKDKYADEDEEYEADYVSYDNQAYAAALQDQIAATNAAIHNHNLAVQAFVSHAANRPRARTAGVLDAPGSRVLRGYMPTSSRLDSGLTVADIQLPEEKSYDDQLPQAVAALSLGRSNSINHGNSANGAVSGGGSVNGTNGLLSADEPGIEGPTSALWLGSIPTSTTTSTLTEMFKSYGPILSARVLTLKNCGFVNFERVDSAINAKASLNGKEIFPGAGPVRINFAKPPSSSNTPGHDGVFPSPSPDPFGVDGKSPSTLGAVPGSANGSVTPGAAGLSGAASAGDGEAFASGTAPGSTLAAIPSPAPLSEITGDILKIVAQFGATDEDTYRISSNLQKAAQYTTFKDEIPPIPEPSSARVYDAPKLRDIRKRIDNQSLSASEIEHIAMEMLPEIAELASDYLGNTVVQKLFEHCSDDLRDLMLAEIAPHLAEIGVHKNGTWAAQKIIDVCKTPQQMSVIVEHIHPYTMPLFLDQYGNYVLQGCLKFGAPYNDYIFETMLSRLWEIAQGRFGARAMRACLESHHATKDQQRMLAAAIALNSVQLATNANGALLLTWLLDTCTFQQRRTVLSPQLVPYLVHLCTHKVAYLTVLKVVNQKAEAEARDTVLNALFSPSNDRVLEQILSDSACGATLIYKVITTPFFEENVRNQVVESVKAMLVHIKAQPAQGYKRLMDEVGLSTRSGGGSGGGVNGGGSAGGSRDHSATNEKRPASRQASGHHHPSHNNHNGVHNPGQGQGQSLGLSHHPHHNNGARQQQAQQPQAQQSQQSSSQQSPPHANQASFNGNAGPYYNTSPNPTGFDPSFGAPRGDNSAGVEGGAGMVPPAFGPYPGQAAVYGIPGQPVPPLGVQPIPYQAGMLARGGPAMGGYYPPPPQMQSGYGVFNGAAGPSPTMDAYRNGGMPNNVGGPMPTGVVGAQPAPFIPAGYGMGPAGPYAYPGGMPLPAYGSEQMGTSGPGARRGRGGGRNHHDANSRQY